MHHATSGDVTVSAWIGSSNLGDELVAAALVAKLRARGVAPALLSVNPTGTEAAHGARAVTLLQLARHPRSRAPGTILGGGGLLQDETSVVNLPYHLGRTGVASWPRRPVAGVGLGAGPISGRLGRALVGRALRGAVGISVRDEGSQAVLAGVGVRSSLAADLAVSLPIPHVEVQPRLAVSLRPWTGRDGVLPVSWRLRRGGAPAAPEWFTTGMAAALDAVAVGTGLLPHFVALQADRDDAVHRAVASRMRTPCTFATPDVHGVVAEVAACQAVVAMRYHAGVAALLGGRPAVLLGYSPKVPALAAEVPGGMSGVTWDATGLATLPKQLERILDGGEAVLEGRERLRHRERANDEVIDLLVAAARRTGP